MTSDLPVEDGTVEGKTDLVLSAENVERVMVHPYSLYNKLSRRQLSRAMKSKAGGTFKKKKNRACEVKLRVEW